jgi:hypothetical protein
VTQASDYPSAPADCADVHSASLIDQVQPMVAEASIALSSGRRYDLEAGPEADRLVIRSRGGQVVLRIEVTDAGPVLSFSGATVDISASRRLRLAAGEVTIEATGDVSVVAGGSLREAVAGSHHARIAGDERLEAANVQIQASEGSVGLRAQQGIALDGEHIGLNDDPLPKPFAWSGIAAGPGDPDVDR